MYIIMKTLSGYCLYVNLKKYPNLSDKVITFLLPFYTTWMCEIRFWGCSHKNQPETETLLSINICSDFFSPII